MAFSITGNTIGFKNLNGSTRTVGYKEPLPIEFAGNGASLFGEGLVTQRRSVFYLQSIFGTSALRDVETTTGGGTITLDATSGELLLSTSATATSSATLETAEVIQYAAGYPLNFGMGTRAGTNSPTGNTYYQWGARTPDGNDGFYMGADSTGKYVAILRNTVETKVYQSDWNGDKVDGSNNPRTNPSHIDLDFTKGYIYWFDLSWYGYGNLVVKLMASVDWYQRPFVLHTFESNSNTSITNPNLDLFQEVDNGGDSTDIDLYVGGRGAAVVGDVTYPKRYVSDFNTVGSIGTTPLPLVSARIKSTTNNRQFLLDSFEAFVTTENCLIQFYLDGTLTGASFGVPTNHTDAEIATEFDTTASAISGGTLLWSEISKAGDTPSRSFSNEGLIDANIPTNSIVTMAARTLSGSGASVTGNMRIRETW